MRQRSIPRHKRRYSFDPLTSWPYRSQREMSWSLVAGIAFQVAVVAAPLIVWYSFR